MQILNAKQINQKITRLAYEIVEDHIEDDQVTLIGLNTNGKELAKRIADEVKSINGHDLTIEISHANYNGSTKAVSLDNDVNFFVGKSIIIIDDVSNTGTTLFKTTALLANIDTNSIRAAVLIDRKHKSAPIQVDYMGLSLATTINDHILVTFAKKNQCKAEFGRTKC